MKVRVSIMVVVFSSLASCADRTHLREDYGKSTRSAMARQAVHPDAGTSAAEQVLDQQEAAILTRTLRRNLAPKDQVTTTSDQILYISPQAQKPRSDDLPPPSIPNQGR